MSANALVLVALMSAAALALWLDSTFAERTPRTFLRALVHGGLACVAVQLAPTLERMVVSANGSPASRMTALLVVVLPIFVYTWLSSIWIMKLAMRQSRLR